jgi:hypothetical protein
MTLEEFHSWYILDAQRVLVSRHNRKRATVVERPPRPGGVSNESGNFVDFHGPTDTAFPFVA